MNLLRWYYERFLNRWHARRSRHAFVHLFKQALDAIECGDYELRQWYNDAAITKVILANEQAWVEYQEILRKRG